MSNIRKTLDNNDFNQVVASSGFSENKGLGGVLSLSGSKTWSRSFLLKDFGLLIAQYMPGGVANLLDNHTSQILDKNQDDLNFSYDLQRTIAYKQALHHVYSCVLLSCDFLWLPQMESLLAG